MTTMETVKQAPQSPGSYGEYLAAHPELDQSEAAERYYGTLDVYRDQLADYHGVSREELHDMKFQRIGHQATASQIETV